MAVQDNKEQKKVRITAFISEKGKIDLTIYKAERMALAKRQLNAASNTYLFLPQ